MQKVESRRKLPKFALYGVGLLLIILILGVYFWTKKNENKWMHLSEVGIRVPLKYDIHGIDLSHHNGEIKWAKLRQMTFSDLRLQFVYLKATEGTSLQDKDFEDNWTKADEIGLYRGAYHFYIPWKDPEPQAENFIKMVSLTKGDLPPVLDFETGTNKFSQEKVIENLKIWLELIENHYEMKPIIYTNANFYKRYVKDHIEGYPLWIADYSGWALNRYDNANIVFWQHSKAASIAGIRGNVDFNTYLGDDLEDLVK